MKHLLAFAAAASLAAPIPGHGLSPMEELGARLFFDPSLSTPPGQSCASCHDPATGWTGPDSGRNARGAVYPGAVPERFGNRKPPAAAYAGFHPVLHRCGIDCPGGIGGMSCGATDDGMGGGGMGGGGMGGGGMGGGGTMAMGELAGGSFWDGRATGWTLGDPLAEQAMGPFLNPLEQNGPSAKHVCLRVRESVYAPLFVEVWGPRSLDCVKDVDGTYARIAHAIAAYERSSEVSAFTSKFDRFWDRARAAGLSVPMIHAMNLARFRGKGLTETELQGLAVFNGKGRCSACHSLQPMHGSPYPLFTDFRFHNVGLPRNPENPFYGMPRPWNPDGAAWIDPGLGGFLATTAGAVDSEGVVRDYAALAPENLGKHKTPTLRNVEKRPGPDFVKAYGHNGYFKSLAAIVAFYDTRDALPACDGAGAPGADCWPAPEVAANVDARVGNLGLTAAQEEALLAFLRTLDDGFVPPAP